MDYSPNLQQTANVPLLPPTQEYWSEEEKSVIMEHVVYHKKMLEMLEHVKSNGPVKKLISPPKRKLMDVFNEKLGKKKKIEDTMTTAGLHQYLKEHIVDMTKSISRDKFNFKANDIREAIAQLQEAHTYKCFFKK